MFGQIGSQLTKGNVMKILDIPRSGSIAGTTSSHNRAGQYVRNRRKPVQPVGTGRRGVIKAAFGAASTAYAGLSGSVQAAWQAYADSHPYVDRLGQAIKLTGHQMFVAINTELLNVGAAINPVPPISDVVTAPVITALTCVSTGALTLTLDGSGAATDYVLIAFSKPQSGGIGFCKVFWQQTICAANLATAQVLTTAYQVQFGIPPVGSRIFYRLTPVNQYGVKGVPVEGYITVT